MADMDLRSLEYGELEELILDLGEKKYRAAQIYDWLHKKQADSLDDMGNVPGSLKKSLREKGYDIFTVGIDRVLE